MVSVLEMGLEIRGGQALAGQINLALPLLVSTVYGPLAGKHNSPNNQNIVCVGHTYVGMIECFRSA